MVEIWKERETHRERARERDAHGGKLLVNARERKFFENVSSPESDCMS